MKLWHHQFLNIIFLKFSPSRERYFYGLITYYLRTWEKLINIKVNQSTFQSKSEYIADNSTFVACCIFFLCSLTVFHRGRQQKSGGRKWKSSWADKQHCFPRVRWWKSSRQNHFFIFHSDFNVEISPKNATNHPVALSIFPASVHQSYANLLVFVNFNLFLHINDQFALWHSGILDYFLAYKCLFGALYMYVYLWPKPLLYIGMHDVNI